MRGLRIYHHYFQERVWSLLPLLIFAAIVFITASVSLTLPETTGLQLPQTVADGEKIIIEHSLCGLDGISFCDCLYLYVYLNYDKGKTT